MSIKNAYSEIISFENLLQAEKDSRAGKRYEKEQLSFWGNLEENLHTISNGLKNHNYPPDIYHHFYVYEPKLRKVIYSDYTTKVIQRTAYNVLNPIVCKGMIYDTYSCIKGRGQLKAMQRLASWVDYAEKSGERWYYLKMDVEKFFYRINHDILMNIVKKKFGDKDVVKFMEHYICHASRAFGLPLGAQSPLDIPDEEMLWDVGIAIGGGLSHMEGNLYLDPMDQMAKRGEGIPYYIRYMDDVIILSTDKEELHRYKKIFSDFLGDVLQLRLNKKTAIRPISNGIEFVGYIIRPSNVRLRKSTSLRMKRHLKSVQELYRDYEIDIERARSTLMSYKALMEHCDCRSLEKKIFEEFVLTHGPKEDDVQYG
ncbi:MAG: reverse transcriptase domain-containing protein [Agathobacter sp.]|nr:reverse transcriptase domain-containing protein [Agathobacter sp.]